MKRVLLKDVLKNISKEEFTQYYISENHSQYECSEHFNISMGFVNGIIKIYDIHKSKQQGYEITKKIKQERYGNPNYNNRDKAMNTCIEKYGVDNPFKDLDKVRNSYFNSFGYDHPMHNPEIANRCISNHDYDEITRKGRETYKNEFGYDNPAKNSDVIRKGIDTKKKRGLFGNESNLERRLEKILNRKFKDTIHHYNDIRYSREDGYEFDCDFYIPSEDLFIELNAHPTHGVHPFNEYNDEDCLTKTHLSESKKDWDRCVLETWCERDVEKMSCARKNNLNYIVLYPSSSIFDNTKFNDKRYAKLVKYLLTKLLSSK